MCGADVVFTGEGKMDSQSLRGKVVIGVSRRAQKAGVPVVVIAGGLDEGLEPAYEMGVSAAFSISRSTAAAAIGAMKVALNDEIVTKCDKAVCEGDKIRLRGKGRAFLKEVSGKSRKGRIFIKFDVNI